MAQNRWARARQQAAKYITREAAAIDPTINTWSEAWGLLAAKQYLALMDSEKPRGDDLYRIGQVMGALPTALEQRSMEAGPAPATDADAAAMLAADIAARIIARLMQQQRGEAEGVVIDAE
jgi:hypothetical protein